MVDDVARVQLEGIFLRGSLGQYDGRVQGAQAAGGSMRDEMDIRELLRRAAQVSRRGGLSSGKNFALRWNEMLFDIFDFDAGFRQLAVFRIGGDGIADEQELTRASA